MGACRYDVEPYQRIEFALNKKFEEYPVSQQAEPESVSAAGLEGGIVFAKFDLFFDRAFPKRRLS